MWNGLAQRVIAHVSHRAQGFPKVRNYLKSSKIKENRGFEAYPLSSDGLSFAHDRSKQNGVVFPKVQIHYKKGANAKWRPKPFLVVQIGKNWQNPSWDSLSPSPKVIGLPDGARRFIF